jgi:KDO2-lipid IV(A) lauroyltransferase
MIAKLLVPPAAWFIGVLIRCFATKEKRQLKINIHKIFNLPPHSSFAKSFERQCLNHQTRSALESLWAIFHPKAIKITGFEEFHGTVQALKGSDHGVIVISAHLGSWELLAKFTALAFEGPIYVLAKPAKVPLFSKFLKRVRREMGADVLWSDSKSLLKDMLRVMREGKLLGFVMDQKPANRIGTRLDFLGEPAEFVAGPSAIALKTRSPIVAAYCLRTGPWEYHLISKEVWRPAAATEKPLEEAQLTEKLVRNMEEVIRLYPEQWTWNYKRWKFREV